METLVRPDIRLEDVFGGRRVFVTGDTGFKGSWLALWLRQLGADVRGFALPPERSEDHYVVAGLSNEIDHIDGDIRDLGALKKAFLAWQPSVVIHLAAQALVSRSYLDPVQTFETNVMGSVHLMEAVRKCPTVRSLIVVTSDKCYRNNEWVWGYREHDALGGKDPYSASKAADELVIGAYLESFFRDRAGLGVASVRAGNVIGGGDWSPDRIVPDLIRGIRGGTPIHLRRPGAARPWQHVLEPIGGYLLLAARLLEDPVRYSGSWNFGPRSGDVRTVHELALAVLAHWGDGELVLPSADEDAPMAEANTLHLNCDKAHHRLGWYPKWSFDRCVSETVEWYKAADRGDSPLAASVAQIESYGNPRPLGAESVNRGGSS